MEPQPDAKPEAIPPSLLVSATYDSKERVAVLKFYEPKSQRIILWPDKTGHKPYCYSRLPPDELDFLTERDDVIDIQSIKRHDLLNDCEVEVSKITVKDPLAIGGTQTNKSIRNSIETWESDIKYYENYLYDESLTVGKYYEVINGTVRPHDMEVPEGVRQALELLQDGAGTGMADAGQFREFTQEWAGLLGQPIPKIKRLSFDIEVESEVGRIPDPKLAEKKVTAIGFDGTDGFRQVFVLRKEGAATGTNELDQSVKVVFYDEEKEMIKDAFGVIESFPFVLTYNGDEFDMPYLYNRAQKLGIPYVQIPLYMMRDSATLKHGVHIDLYRTLSNRSFQIYAFSAKYSDYSLNSVSKALLGEEKVNYGVGLDELDLYQTANYCYNDARLTHELTTFNNNILMDLLVVISRIAKMPMDDIARMGVSQWIRSLLYYEHRRRNALIPRRDELEKKSTGVSNDAVIKDKKFRGGLVVDPEEGIHFDVTVLDFASLYPSIIKVRNISYETVRCPHPECKKNAIPGTAHWACTVRNGMTALLIGSLRDLRVGYYKNLSKDPSLSEDQRQQYTVVSQALKVILNASYGVMGAEIFPLYFLPAAEATTAIGRHIIMQTIEGCKGDGIQVLYGDSVMKDTPIICIKNGLQQIISIGSLQLPNNMELRRPQTNLKVLSDDTFVDVSYSFAHEVKKTGYRIGTRHAYVEVTDDHSLIIDGKEVRPSELKIGDKIDISNFHQFPSTYDLDAKVAWLLGFFIAKGTIGNYDGKIQWKISQKDPRLLEYSKNIIMTHMGLSTQIKKCASEEGMHELITSQGSSRGIYEFFKYHCYSHTTKIIPAVILNGTSEVKKQFMNGLIDGDGHIDEKDKSITFGQIHKSVLAGYISIITSLNYYYTLKFRGDKPNYISICVIRNKDDWRIREENVINYLEKFEINDYVCDLSTANEHFRGGLGNVLLHNTDSLFFKKPTKQQIQHVIERAKKDHGVELEVDKEYRYVVLSNRKKNYFGVTKSGKVDVKGLTGKKSHTPPFIRSLFYELLEVLAKVQDEEGFKSAKRQISQRIAECGKRIESRDIPLKELAFNVMISKAPSEYVKTIPQHIRAARLLEPTREIKKGDIISYVKTINRPGVKPVEMARQDEIDSKKYTEALESTLDQITSSMGLDFDEMLGKPKQTGLDDFFEYV